VTSFQIRNQKCMVFQKNRGIALKLLKVY